MKTSIIVCKTMKSVLSKLGRGSSLPGAVALKLDRNVLGKLKISCPVIAVTGSNGKTGTTEMLNRTAKAAGMRTVCNSEGSNQIEGVTAALLGACDLSGKIAADAVILESDERFCQYTFKGLAPTATVVTNLFRDQLTRNGHWEFVAKELRKGLRKDTIPVLNADDPLTAPLGKDYGNAVYFGVSPDAFSEDPATVHAYDDGAFCPCCGGRMHYSTRLFAHLGSYHCASCGFARPSPAHEVTGTDGDCLVLDGGYRIRPKYLNSMYAQNVCAAFTAAVEILGIAPEKAAEYLSEEEERNKLVDRVHVYDLDGRDLTFLLCKHENSMAYNQSLASVLARGGKASLLIIVDKFSRKYSANDMSWLWDLDLGKLSDPRIGSVVFSGRFAEDLKSRSLLDGVPGDKITAEPDLGKALTKLRTQAEGDLFAMTCFTDAPMLKQAAERYGK